MAQILFIDDEKIIREGLSMLINRIMSEHNCILADNGKKALEIIESSNIDLIISDIKMPVMDGMELAKELSSREYQIPFIFLTGFEDFKLVQQAMRYRVVDYLLKPINELELKKVITTNLEDRSTNRGKEIPHHTKTMIKKFEFELSNSLESLKVEGVSKVIKSALDVFADNHLVYREIQRVANNYFIKQGIHGLDLSKYRKPLNDDQLIQMVTEIIEQLRENREDGNSIIEDAKNYMILNITKPPTLVEVADSVHFNPNYFSDYFKQKTGETFSDYLTRLRIEEAKGLLTSPSIKVKDVSKQVGYQDVRHFSKKFKEAVGVSPNEYRRRQ